MNWPKSYQDRLTAWVHLRTTCMALDTESTLQAVNRWWQASPWRPYYLHWEDRREWPDPWQLLADNIYCDLARALGMLYTITLLDRDDFRDACLVRAAEGNLVLIQQGKYIMNWTPDGIVNIGSQQPQIQTVLEPAVLDLLIG